MRALNLWSTGVFDTKEAAAAMNDDKWGVEAERQARRLRAVMNGKPEKWAAIVTLAKAAMKKGASKRVQESDVDGGSSDEEVFLSGDEIEADEEDVREGGESAVTEAGVAGVQESADGEARVVNTVAGHESSSREGGNVDHIGASGQGGIQRGGEGSEQDTRAIELYQSEVTRPATSRRHTREVTMKPRTKVRAKVPMSIQDDGVADGNTDEAPPVIKRRKRRAVVEESEPEYDDEAESLTTANAGKGSVKRRKGDDGVVTEDT